MGLTKQQLEALNDSSFPNNTAGLITPQVLRDYNDAVIGNTVNQDGYTTDSASFNSRIAAITSSAGINTGSFATTGSNNFVGNQTITGSVIGNSNINIYSQFPGISLRGNAEGSGSQYPFAELVLDSEAYSSEGVIGAWVVADPSTSQSVGMGINTYTNVYGYPNPVPVIYGQGLLFGTDDTLIGFPAGKIDLWRNTDLHNNLIVSGTATFSELTGSLGSFSASVSNRINNITSSVSINTGSFATTGSNLFIGGQQVVGPIQAADTNYGPQWVPGVVFQGVGSASVAYDQFITGGNYDGFHVQSNLNAGTDFQDLPSDTFVLNTWLNIPTNTGNNPAPQFKRGLGVTGSTSINGTLQISSSATYDLDITGGWQATAACRISSSTSTANIATTFLQITSGSTSNNFFARGYTALNLDGNQIILFASGGTGIGGVGTAPIGSSGIGIRSGSINNAFYYPITFQSALGYTDGRVTFSTPIIASSSVFVRGGLYGANNLITTGSATLVSQAISGGFEFNTKYTTANPYVTQVGGGTTLEISYGDIFNGTKNGNDFIFWLDTNFAGVSVTGSGITNGAITGYNYGSGVEVYIQSGTITNGATYTFTGPAQGIVEVTGSLHATKELVVNGAYDARKAVVDQNGFYAVDASGQVQAGASIDAGVYAGNNSNGNYISFAATSSIVQSNSGPTPYDTLQIAATQNNNGRFTQISFQGNNDYTDGTITVHQPLFASSSLRVANGAIITGSVTISGSATSDLTVVGQIFVSSSAATGGTAVPKITVSGSAGTTTINRNSITTRNATNQAVLNPSFTAANVLATNDEIGFSVDPVGGGVGGWTTGPAIYVNNDAGDTYPAVFGFQDKANYTDGRVTVLTPLVVSQSMDFYAHGHKQFNVGSFYSTVTQSGSAAVSQSMTFNTTDISNGITMVSGSQFTVANAGVYNIQFSAQILADTGADDVWIWLKKNGTNVADSAGRVTLNNNDELMAAWNYVVSVNANDYIELVWQSTNGDAVLLYNAATGNIPAVTSVIATVTQVR